MIKSTTCLALCLAQLAGVPSIALAQATFENRTVDAGLHNYSASSADIHGPGAVFTDLNNDGLPDLYLVRGGNVPGASYPNELYLNQGSGLMFARPSNDAGAAENGPATGAIAADYDNDGDVDLFVVNYNGPNVLLKNTLSETGVLAFVDVTSTTDPSPGVADDQHGVAAAFHIDPTYGPIALDNSLTAAWSDVDRDGDLDLFVGNHDAWCLQGTPESPYGVPGQRDIFYRNNGDGTFTDISLDIDVTGYESIGGASRTSNQDFSSTNAAAFADFDNDGWPDLLVTNKVGGLDDRNMLYRNRGVDISGNWLGFEIATYNLRPVFGQNSGGAMGVDIGDPDNDGDLDIYITDVSPLGPSAPGRNDYWINQLSETGNLHFVYSSALPATFSWGAQWQDFDLNGHQDLYVASHTGARDYFYGNDGDNWTEDAAGAGVEQNLNSRTAVSADYDRDGWPDLFVVSFEGSALFRNISSSKFPQHHYLILRLQGDPGLTGRFASNRSAIGARARLVADLNGDGIIESNEVQIREVISGSSNAGSTASQELEFGLGLATSAQVEITWPSGRSTVFGALADLHLNITETGDNGSLLRNGGFESGLSHWSTPVNGASEADWVLDDTDAASGTYSLRTDINNNDGTPWNILAVQGGRPIEKNRSYRLRFSTKASINTRMIVRIAQSVAPWADLGLSQQVPVSTQWQEHMIDFVGTATELNARLNMMLGFDGPHTIWLDDVQLTLLPLPVPTSQQLTNGGFELGNVGWSTLSLNGSSASADYGYSDAATGAVSLKIDLLADSGTDWHAQSAQSGFKIDAGMRYRLKFDAKANAAGDIIVQIGQNSSPWVNLGQYSVVGLNTLWQSFDFEFIASATEVDARLAFLFGAGGTRIIQLDSVSLETLPPNPPPALIPADLLPNGNFEQGLLGWRTENFAEGLAAWTIDSSTSSLGASSIRADIQSSDDVPWHIQMIQDGLGVQEGLNYRITLNAKSDVISELVVAIGQNHAPWANLGLRQSVTLAPEWQSFEFLFAGATTDPDARIAVQLGTGPARSVWIDSVGAVGSCAP